MHPLHIAIHHAGRCTRRFAPGILVLPALLACDESTPTSWVAPEAAASVVAAEAIEPFTSRAPLDPFRVHQLPEFIAHAADRTDFVIQRLVLPPGPVPWHTHPGPSFVIVEEGQVQVQFVTDISGCEQTPVLGPGNAFIRAGNQVHRLTVLGTTDAILYVARFNVPVGGAITDPADDPGC